MNSERRSRKGRRRALEAAKSVLLAALAVLALYLAFRAQFDSDLSTGSPGGWLGALLDMMPRRELPSGGTEVTGGLPLMAAQAVRVAVSSGDSRTAVQYDSAQADKAFDGVSSLLSEGLASARTPRQITERQWREALGRPGIYFDFLGKIPLGALYTWLGEGGYNAHLTGTARRILLAYDGGSSVLLYYNNEESGLYYACETSVTYEGHMEETVMSMGGNSASFAFELTEAGYGALDPYVLILPQTPAPKVYRSGNPLAEEARMNEVRRVLSFRPQAGAEYPMPGGIMIREGKETLQIGSSGTIHYNASEAEASRYAVGEPGNVVGQIETARQLLAGTAGLWCGSARLYLMSYAMEADGSEVLEFGYSLDGAAVQLYDTGYGAQFTFRGGRLTDYVIHFRAYEDSGESTSLLPERQAAAALGAMRPDGRELVLCYEDGGGDQVEAGWVAQ